MKTELDVWIGIGKQHTAVLINTRSLNAWICTYRENLSFFETKNTFLAKVIIAFIWGINHLSPSRFHYILTIISNKWVCSKIIIEYICIHIVIILMADAHPCTCAQFSLLILLMETRNAKCLFFDDFPNGKCDISNSNY